MQTRLFLAANRHLILAAADHSVAHHASRRNSRVEAGHAERNRHKMDMDQIPTRGSTWK